MTQWLRVLAAFAEDWSSVPSTQPPVTIFPRNLTPFSGFPQAPALMCTYTHMHTHIHVKIFLGLKRCLRG